MPCRLILGDNKATMRALLEEGVQVDAVVTDPPYGLNFMGSRWDCTVPDVETWRLVFALLKPGGHLLAFAGTRTQHRMAVAIEDAGFEIRDMIAWVYGSGFPKSHNVGKALDREAGAEREVVGRDMSKWRDPANHSGATVGKDFKSYETKSTITAPATEEAAAWEGWGTALKPALEPITLARKPIAEKTVAANVLKYGTGAINVDGTRIPMSNADAETIKNMGGFGVKGFVTEKGRSLVKSMKPQTSPGVNVHAGGRWPANLIHDGSPEVVRLFPAEAGGGAQIRKNNNSKTTGPGIAACYGKFNDSVTYGFGDAGSAARFFYCPKATKEDRDAGLAAFEKKQRVYNGNTHRHSENFKKGSMTLEDRFTPDPNRNLHPTVKPFDLMRYLCTMITPPGGIILDPFMGSGSTGRAALVAGFGFIGLELDPEYFKIAEARVHAGAVDFIEPETPDQLGFF